MDEKKQISGIGGWLILPMLGLFATPIRLGFSLLRTFVPIFTTGAWENLTTKGTEAYHPLWAPLLIFEFIGNTVFIIFAIFLLILLFKKHYLFPTLVIIFIAANLFFVLSDFIMAGLIPAVAMKSDLKSLRELIRITVFASIWIPYFIVSVRVKNTFRQPSIEQDILISTPVEPLK